MVITAINCYEWYGFEVSESQTRYVVQLINTCSEVHESQNWYDYI